jgi:hypothetical protein
MKVSTTVGRVALALAVGLLPLPVAAQVQTEVPGIRTAWAPIR